MDRRSWPWKKKSSDKTVTEKPTAHVDSAVSNGSHSNQVKVYEEQVKDYEEMMEKNEEEVRSLAERTKDLTEKLSAAQAEITNKDDLVKQHAKVAEEAVSGWEKAEAEALALKNQLECVTLSKLKAEDRASHLDGALKECMRQIWNLKEEHEQELQEVIITKTNQWDKIKLDLEAKIANFHQELLRSEAENAAISRSLQDRSNMLVKVSEEKSQAEAEIEIMQTNIDSCEREINSLKYEVHVVSKELEIRNEEKNMSMKSAEAANKQHMEGVKKIAKLEAECQRLRGLVRKKLPGPAALAQMKVEVESCGRDFCETRFKKTQAKSSSLHFSAMTEFSFDEVQKSQKENEMLTERLFAMEEETKMLKEALAKRNSQLQASRNLCAKTATMLQSLELQMKHNSQQTSPAKLRSPSSADGTVIQISSNPPSLGSLSEDGNDDLLSCADSYASTLISERLQIKRGKGTEQFDKNENAYNFGLMDDFLEMEKLAGLSNNENKAVSPIGTSDKNISDISCHDASSDPLAEKQQALSKQDSMTASHAASTVGSDGNEPAIHSLRLKMFSLLESLSNDTVMVSVLDKMRRAVQEAYDSTHQRTINYESDGKHRLVAAPNRPSCTEVAAVSSNKDSTLPQEDAPAKKSAHLVSKDLEYAISKIHEFVIFIGKEATAVHQTSLDGDSLSRKAEGFSVTINKVLQNDVSLVTFVLDLSEVLDRAREFRFGVLSYRATDLETYSPDCIDKVALPENKMVQKDSSEDGYDHSCVHNSDPEVPDDCNLVRGYESNSTSCKFSLEDYQQLKSNRDNMENELAGYSESLQMTTSQLEETEQRLADVKSQLTAAQNSHSLAETKLKCMAESYRSLESHAEELETQLKCMAESDMSIKRRAGELETDVSILQVKIDALENELQEEKVNNQDALARCKELEEHLKRNNSCSGFALSSAADADLKTKQDRELSAAAENLAECQETIFLLGKQLKAFHPSTDFKMGSPYSERSPGGEVFAKESTTSCMNLGYSSNAEMGTSASTNSQSVDGNSPSDVNIAPCSPNDAEANKLLKSPSNSKTPKHRHKESGSTSSSLEKHSRGFGRFFASKGKNSH